MKTAYVMVGVPGSGKSTYAESLGLKIISSDAIRERDYAHLTNSELHTPQVNKEVFEKAWNEMKECNTSFVFDATNLNRKKRINLYRYLKALGYLVEINIVIEPLSVILKQNKMRKRRVPVSVIKKMYASMQPPRVGIDCDIFNIINRYPMLSKDLYMAQVDLFLSMKVKGISGLIEDYISSEWKEELVNIVKSHDTPYHLESIDEHINMCFINAEDFLKNTSLNYHAAIYLTTILHDLGKSVTKNGGHYFGHENVSSIYALLLLSEVYNIKTITKNMDTIITVVVEVILSHMMAHQGISDKVIKRHKLNDTELKLIELFKNIDQVSRVVDGK